MFICVTLAGVWIALTPVRHFDLKGGVFWAGTFFGVCASLGQAGGAVISRKAYDVAIRAGLHMDGGTAAYQRMIAGILVSAAYMFLTKKFRLETARPVELTEERKLETRKAWLWVVLNAIAGPTLGVACFQWGLSVAPSGIVLPIVATTPVVAIPLTYWIDGDRPSMRSVVGGVIAVGGAVALAMAKASH
jgi:drug/metabolite transporter (DMT)-like permease